MNSIFNIDGPLWRFLSLLGDMVILHILWLVCSIPLITIGPATVAAHWVAMKIVRDEGRGVFREFFKSFRANFRQGIILGLIFFLLGSFLALDFYLMLKKIEASNMFMLVMLSLLCLFAFLYLFVFIYVWAVQAKFSNSIYKTIANAFFISMSHVRDSSVMLAQDILLVVAAVLSYAFLPQVFIVFCFFGVPMLFVINSRKLRRILDEFLPKEDHKIDDIEQGAYREDIGKR